MNSERYNLRATWMASSAAALLLLAACSDESTKSQAAITGGDWPSYGHDGKNTRFNDKEKTVGKSNVAKLTKKWDSAQMGTSAFGVTSTPAVKDGVVYFGDWGGRMIAVDAKDGTSVWATQLSEARTGQDAQINASAWVTEDRVYVGGTNNRVYAVDRASGAKLWDPYKEIGSEPQVIFWSSPNIVDDTMILGIGSFQVFLPGPYSFRGNVVGVNATSGDVKWTTFLTDGDDKSGFGCSVWGSAAVDKERKLAYIGVGQSYTAPASQYSDAVVAMDYATGEIKWGHQFTKDDIFTLTNRGDDFDVGASVVLYEIDGKAFVAAGDKGGHLHALDRDTGDLVWATELTAGGRTGGVMASPAVADGVIYIYSNDGIAENLGSDGPSAGSAFAVNGATGEVIWQTKMEPGSFGGIAVANGVMYFTTLDGVIHGLDTETGAELWSDELMDGSIGKAAGGVTVANGMVYAGAGWAWTPLGAPPPGGVAAYGLP